MHRGRAEVDVPFGVVERPAPGGGRRGGGEQRVAHHRRPEEFAPFRQREIVHAVDAVETVDGVRDHMQMREGVRRDLPHQIQSPFRLSGQRVELKHSPVDEVGDGLRVAGKFDLGEGGVAAPPALVQCVDGEVTRFEPFPEFPLAVRAVAEHMVGIGGGTAAEVMFGFVPDIPRQQGGECVEVFQRHAEKRLPGFPHRGVVAAGTGVAAELAAEHRFSGDRLAVAVDHPAVRIFLFRPDRHHVADQIEDHPEVEPLRQPHQFV